MREKQMHPAGPHLGFLKGSRRNRLGTTRGADLEPARNRRSRGTSRHPTTNPRPEEVRTPQAQPNWGLKAPSGKSNHQSLRSESDCCDCLVRFDFAVSETSETSYTTLIYTRDWLGPARWVGPGPACVGRLTPSSGHPSCPPASGSASGTRDRGRPR